MNRILCKIDILISKMIFNLVLCCSVYLIGRKLVYLSLALRLRMDISVPRWNRCFVTAVLYAYMEYIILCVSHRMILFACL